MLRGGHYDHVFTMCDEDHSSSSTSPWQSTEMFNSKKKKKNSALQWHERKSQSQSVGATDFLWLQNRLYAAL